MDRDQQKRALYILQSIYDFYQDGGPLACLPGRAVLFTENQTTIKDTLYNFIEEASTLKANASDHLK